MQEKFHEDWTHDQTWGWQQNRAVVGHNLKIAWNLMRVHHIAPHDEYVALAEKIAALMPEAGMDKQRAGWYDVVERVKGPGEEYHHFAWHDRKAWWQQEQAILAYLILAGSLKKDEYLRLARESSAFYNAFFPDHDNGGVYFNVLANGIPYLLGTERLKGSHSMAGVPLVRALLPRGGVLEPDALQAADGPALQAEAGRAERWHPPGVAGHPAQGFRANRSGLDQRPPARRLRR